MNPNTKKLSKKQKATVQAHSLGDVLIVNRYTAPEFIGTYYQDGIRYKLFYQFDLVKQLHCIGIWKYCEFNTIKATSRYYDGAITKEQAISAVIDAFSLTEGG
jgi:hypothetical protein